LRGKRKGGRQADLGILSLNEDVERAIKKEKGCERGMPVELARRRNNSCEIEGSKRLNLGNLADSERDMTRSPGEVIVAEAESAVVGGSRTAVLDNSVSLKEEIVADEEAFVTRHDCEIGKVDRATAEIESEADVGIDAFKTTDALDAVN
jgi:hypothetical protein